MIRLATVGTSAITEKFLDAVRLTGRFEHTAVFSRNRQTGETFANKVGCKTVFTDLNKLAQSDCIDAVYIATPNVCHFEQSRLFLQNGKNVICEKPITTNALEYKKLKALADKNGLVYIEAIMSRHTAARTAVIDAVSKIGKISMARIDYCQLSSRYQSFMEGNPHNIFDMSLYAGTLMDLGIYCVYGAVDLLGVPNSITASASYFDNGCDKDGCAVFDYGDFKAVLTYSKTGQSALGSEIIGDSGTLRLESISQYAGVTLINGDKETQIFDFPERALVMRGEADNFADFIEGINLEEYAACSKLALQVHTCMDKIKKSAGLRYK